jgi:Cd2+-exporting ATPase
VGFANLSIYLKSINLKFKEYTDRIAGYLGPIALAAAVIAFIVWFLVNWRLRGQDVSSAIIQGLTYTIAILAITYPCTIDLAVPMNVVIASGIAARKGILIKDTHALEVMHRVKIVVFEKTGILTKGEPEVMKEIIYIDGVQDYIRRLVAKAAHPIAKAVSKQVGDAEPYDNIEHIVGKGLQFKIEKGTLRGGSATWLDIESPFGLSHLSIFAVKVNDQLVVVYGLTDQLRPESVKVVNDLKARDIDVYLVSGDNSPAVHDIARQLNIPSSNVKSNTIPAVKSEIVSFLQSRSGSPVLFCGDGMNDAPALSQVNVGISFVSAAEITSTSASILLLSNELGSIITLLSLSQRVYRRIVINFVWAGIYNLFAIALAAGALVVWRIDPRWAGIGELVSVLPAVIVGWSLNWNKY